MNARIALTAALAVLVIGVVAWAEEAGFLRGAVDDHFYLLNSSAKHEGLVAPVLEADVQPVRSGSARGELKSNSSGYATFSTASANDHVSKRTSANVASSGMNVPPMWIGIMCAGAGMGLVVVGAVAWKRRRPFSRDWMTDESEGRLSYRRWGSASVHTTLASKLIQAQDNSVKSPAVVVEPEETRKLRRAA
jgi:hypothetical protein